MRWHVAGAALLALVLGVLARGEARADDDDYAKVEVKGWFAKGDSFNTGKLLVIVREQSYELNFVDFPGGAPAKKALEALDEKRVHVRGRLVVPQPSEMNKRPHPRIYVESIALVEAKKR